MAQHQRPECCGTYSAIGLLQLHLLNSSLSVRDSVPGSSGPPKSDPLTFVLAAHLLQQMVDARASEHVENFASTASIDM